jgi:hypothetical protein
MLYFITKDFKEASIVMLSVSFALIGGVYLIYFLGYNFSVAVWFGFYASHCCTDNRRINYIHDTCFDSNTSFVQLYERTSIEERKIRSFKDGNVDERELNKRKLKILD